MTSDLSEFDDRDPPDIGELQERIGRKPRPRRPRRMSQVVSGLMAKRGFAHSQSDESIQEAWRKAAGELANLSRAVRIRSGNLEILASGSIVVQEISFQKHTLLTRLRELMPAARLRDLRVKLGVW